MDIKRLREMDALRGEKKPQAVPERSYKDHLPLLFPEGQYKKNSKGKIFCVSSPPVKIGLKGKDISPLLSLLAGKEGRADPFSFLFFDVETTGLSGGAGIIVFLFGAGTFSSQGFVVEQYFLNDPSGTPAFLEEILQSFKRASLLFSYNGKSFDLNLIRDKLRMYKFKDIGFIDQIRHIDLLHASRRFFRGITSSCTLKTIEEEILGMKRSEDEIEGWLIPAVYNKHLRSNEPVKELKNIVYHNREDIISLARLLKFFLQVLRDPRGKNANMVEVARVWQRAGEERALELFEHVFSHSKEFGAQAAWQAGRYLAYIKRRSGDLESAVKIWTELSRRSLQDYHPLIDLAKWYEHKKKIPQKALDLVERILEDNITKEKLKRSLLLSDSFIDQLEKRRNRLMTKIRKLI